MTTIRDELRDAIAAARDRALADGALTAPEGIELPAVSIEHPAREEHGDFATNHAMQLAPVLRRSPMQIAEALRVALGSPPG